MSLVYIRSFLCRFVLRLYERTGQAWKYHYQFKCNHKYIKKHELFFFFLNPFLPTSRTEFHDSSCLIWLSEKFIWPNLTWQQGSHGSFISEFYDGAFTFVKMNQNPCFETNICKSARLNSNPLSTVLDDIPSTLSWPSIGGWESSVLRLVCGGLTCCELDALLLLSILEW